MIHVNKGMDIIVPVCYAVLSVLSSFAVISLGKRELVALFELCSYCHVAVGVLRLPHYAVGWSVMCDICISLS